MVLEVVDTFRCVVVHFGDIPADCIARVVGHDHTILSERPSEVTPHAPQSKQISVHRLAHCLTKINSNKGSISSVVVYFTGKSLKKNCVSIERTAELYRKQGNMDITDFVVIDDMTRCDIFRVAQLRDSTRHSSAFSTILILTYL